MATAADTGGMPILAAIDVERAPERPIEVGYDLATAYDDTLFVLYVMGEDEYQRRQEERGEIPEEFQDKFTPSQAAQTAAGEAADAVEATLTGYDDERVETRGSIGEPAPEILAAAEEVDPRYVVVGGRKRSPAAQTIFGSVSQEVVREAEQPVVTLVEKTD